MGFNKVVFLLNDAQSEIDRDPAGWWQACKEAFFKIGRRGPTFSQGLDQSGTQPESFGHGNHCNGWEAVWEGHADYSAVIIAGGNYASVLGSVYNGNNGHHKKEDQIRILKEILERNGYTVVKKPVRTGKVIKEGKNNPPKSSRPNPTLPPPK